MEDRNALKGHVRREKTDDKLVKSKGKSGPRLHTVIGPLICNKSLFTSHNIKKILNTHSLPSS